MFIRRSERVQRDGQSLGLWLRVPVFAVLGGRMRIRIWVSYIESSRGMACASRSIEKEEKVSHVRGGTNRVVVMVCIVTEVGLRSRCANKTEKIWKFAER